MGVSLLCRSNSDQNDSGFPEIDQRLLEIYNRTRSAGGNSAATRAPPQVMLREPDHMNATPGDAANAFKPRKKEQAVLERKMADALAERPSQKDLIADYLQVMGFELAAKIICAPQKENVENIVTEHFKTRFLDSSPLPGERATGNPQDDAYVWLVGRIHLGLPTPIGMLAACFNADHARVVDIIHKCIIHSIKIVEEHADARLHQFPWEQASRDRFNPRAALLRAIKYVQENRCQRA